MERFEKKESLFGILQPGDATRYELVAVNKWDTIEVVVLNDGFFDKITFLKKDGSFYHSFRGENTNPWTIKAAEEMKNRLMQQINDTTCKRCGYSGQDTSRFDGYCYQCFADVNHIIF